MDSDTRSVLTLKSRQTHSWDVRTKHVTSDSIPTLEHVKGLALWGPGASLFTIGPNCTIQQFDLNSPSIMVANVQHPANLLPPSPPNSNEENQSKSVTSSTTIQTGTESDASSIPFDATVSESDEDHMSPFDRIARKAPPASESGGEMSYESYESASSLSGHRKEESTGSKTPGRYPSSLQSRGMTENTYISAGSSLKSSTIGRHKQRAAEMDNYSMGYSLGTTSVSSLSTSRSRQRPSQLRNEVVRSPDGSKDNKVHDLFKYTRTRLSDLAYKHPINVNTSRLTNDDLRRQMLSTIFGWRKDVEDLIRDEMSRHPAGSASRILLAKWLGDMESDILAASSENMTSSDWMLLALSGIGGQASQHKLGQTYVQKLLETGDVHVAVTIMLGMGDHNDAIEAYISHKRYMEALILTCLTFPSVWERQAAIIRKWGEWAVQHGQQQLAIRCFACTEKESTEVWTSPSATQLNFQSIGPSIPEVLSPPLSPPGVQRGPQRSIAKTSALKLITSFDQGPKSKFYAQNDDGQTPIAVGWTPIAESAVEAQEATTAFIRPSNNSRFNTPTSARPSGPSFGRGRLPSIGEQPSSLNRDGLKALEAEQAAEQAAEERKTRKAHSRKTSLEPDTLAAGMSLHRAATASPMMMRDGYQPMTMRGMERDRPPSPTHSFMNKVQDIRANHRNGSRDRIPRGLNLELQPVSLATADQQQEATSPEHSLASSAKFHWPSRRRGPGSVASSVTSASSAGRGHRNATSSRHHRDDHIHSLDTASQFSKKSRNRHASRERTRNPSRGRDTSRERRTVKSRDASEDRSSQKWQKSSKRSPTSPIPMSPEDLAHLGSLRFGELGEAPSTVRKASSNYTKSKPKSRNSSRGSRRPSPERHRPPPLNIRGRSKGREEGGLARSPTSPVPLASAPLHYQGSEDEEDYQRALQDQEMFRNKHNKSASRGLNSPMVTRRDRSASRPRDVYEARDVPPPVMSHNRATSTEHAGDLRRMKEERQRKKELASKELEERRRSLAHRARAPSIPAPSSYSPGFPRVGVESAAPAANPDYVPPRCATEPPKSMYASKGGFHVGLPATPKAMRLMMDGDNNSGGGQSSHRQPEPQPEVPPIPASFAQDPSPKASPNPSPDKEKDEPLLTLLPSTVYQLPSTVYQPPTRPMIPRSMSAPIPDEPGARHRKGSKAGLRGIDEVSEGGRRRSQEEPLPPPPPPPPPAPFMLKELQHLAKPPPPPPAPLPHARHAQGSTALSSGMIEIVMDEDENNNEPPVAAPMDGMVPVLAPPAPPSKSGHSRGRSSVGDSGSISGRLSKATERLRSASRGRKDSSRGHGKSPNMSEAPYESVPTRHFKTASMASAPPSSMQIPPPVMYDPDVIRSPIEGPKGSHLSTGLHMSEMI
jgi:hypothetical protein